MVAHEKFMWWAENKREIVIAPHKLIMTEREGGVARLLGSECGDVASARLTGLFTPYGVILFILRSLELGF